MNRITQPFYDNEDVQLQVAGTDRLILRLNDITGQRDTYFIGLPSVYAKQRNEKFRFFIVHNYSEEEGNELGIWIYAYAPQFNYKIKGCKFSIIKGRNVFSLPVTTDSNSVVGVYRSPCYEVVNNEAVLEILIHLPNMTFQKSDVLTSLGSLARSHQETEPPTAKRAKILSEFNLADDMSASYQNLMNDEGYDCFFLVDGKRIGSFKFPLCAVSDVFRAAFKQHTKESQSGEIEINDFDYDIVKTFVDALHTYKIYFDSNPINILKVKLLAHKYNVASIENAARNAFDVMDVDRFNFVEAYQ